MTGRNHDYFSANHPSFFKQVLDSPVTLHTEPARISGGFTVKYKGQYLHSVYNPLKEAESLLKDSQFKGQKNILLVGLGLGYVLQALQNTTGKNIYIFEPDLELVRLSLEVVDYDGIGSQNHIEFSTDGNDAKKMAGIQDIFILEHPVLAAGTGNAYASFREMLLKTLKLRLSDMTTSGYFSDIWFRNTVRNMKFVRDSIRLADFKDKFSGFWTAIVSAGPTLEQSVALLKKNQDRVLIICTATAVRRIVQEGIEPHFIISTDAGVYNSWHTRNLPDLKSILVSDPSVQGFVNEEYHGPKAFFDFGLGFLNWFAPDSWDIPHIPMAGTVAGSAVLLVRFLGTKGIVLFGQDFSYPDMLSHCRSTIYERYSLLTGSRMRQLTGTDFKGLMSEKTSWDMDYNGRKVLSSLKLELYKDWFENCGLRLMTASDRSARMKNCEPIQELSSSMNVVHGSVFETIKKLSNKKMSDADYKGCKSKALELEHLLPSINDIDSLMESAGSKYAKGLYSYLEFELKRQKTADFIRIRERAGNFLRVIRSATE